jgi:hypothetical protein
VSEKIGPGVLRTGHLVSAEGEVGDVVTVNFDGHGALIERPFVKRFTSEEAFGSVASSNPAPAVLYFADSRGQLTFSALHGSGSSFSFPSGASSERWRAMRTIETVSGADYAEVDGMRSEIDGLATWAGLTTVTQKILFGADKKDLHGFELHAENPEPISLGGPLDLRLMTSFSMPARPIGNTFSVTDIVGVETSTQSLTPWAEHAEVHRMIQDLMCLAFGKPALAQLRQVKREDDQPDLVAHTDKRIWRDAYEPSFGRTGEHVAPIQRDKDEPLFYLKDTDTAKVSTWMQEHSTWGRPIWIAVTTMFQSGTTVESLLLQVAVALEALGYAILGFPSPTPSFPALLESVTDFVGIQHARIYGADAPADWRAKFNTAFKGVKHADNPMPGPNEAYELWRQGLTLLRCWLPIKLGVEPDVLVTALNDQGR